MTRADSHTTPVPRGIQAPFKRLTPARRHFFFAYYDIPAWSPDDTRHLVHETAIWDRLPGPDDQAALAVLRLEDGTVAPFARTVAWNFQQGAMLQWHPDPARERILFNVYEEGAYAGIVHDMRTGAERRLAAPVANVDPRGRYALGINFNRLFEFRPGYGYAHRPDPHRAEAAPQKDGIYRIDLATGDAGLLVSYADMERCLAPEGRGAKLVVNHVTFNTDGSRFLILVRNMLSPDASRRTAALTADTSSGALYRLGGFGLFSHYHWRDPESLLIWSDAGGPPALYLLTDLSPRAEVVDPAFFVRDGHGSYSPDRRWILYDSYPVDGYRRLYLYDLDERRGFLLGSFYSPPAITGDLRCDLHPRWNRTGTAISFDSTHEGFRALYTMDLTAWTGAGG